MLFVLPNGGRGGTQQQVRIVAAELARRGHVVTIGVGGGGLEAVEGVTVEDLPEFSPRRPISFTRAVRALRRRVGATIVHGHGLRLAPVIAWSGAHSRFVTCHGLDPRRAAHTVRAVRRSHVTFVSCGEGPRTVLARHGLHSVVVDNAAPPRLPAASDDELRRAFGLVDRVPTCVLPARFTEQKNHVGLVETLGYVRDALGDESPEVVCLGDGPLRVEVQRLAQRGRDRPLLHCFGHRPDATKWVGASSFFVLSSIWEGQPLVVLEALGANLPVVASTPTGLEDLVMDGRNGRLVASTRDLADVIVQWCRDPASAPRDDTLTAAILARHEVTTVGDRYEELYDRSSS